MVSKLELQNISVEIQAKNIITRKQMRSVNYLISRIYTLKGELFVKDKVLRGLRTSIRIYGNTTHRTYDL